LYSAVLSVFFSSRRRHTIFSRDWSSDVCSSDLVRVYMTTIRSHLTPDVIEGIQLGDEVYFHVTNLEQDWDMPHGFAIKGNNNSELLVMPGETITLKWVPDRVGIFPFYCTDFC